MAEPDWDEPPPDPGYDEAIGTLDEEGDATRHVERALLGAILVDPKRIPDVAAVVTGRDFYSPSHETIWETVLRLDQRREPIDAQTVAAALAPAELRRIGGPLTLVNLTSVDAVVSPWHALTYAKKVADAALRRRLLGFGLKVRGMVETRETAEQAAEDLRQAVEEVTASVRTADAATAVGDSVDSTLDWLQNRPVGAKTPWYDVTDRTNGLVPGQLIVVGARPGHGKSLIAKDVALHTAQDGRGVHIASLEMSEHDYKTRILAGLGSVDLGRMVKNQMTDEDWDKVADAAQQLHGMPLFLDDRPHQTMAQIRSGARHTQRRHGDLGLVVIDYAQLVEPHDTRIPRQEQVSAISRAAKLMAKEFACPVMLLAQLNRGNTNRSDHTPQTSDLRESGSLEQDADQVWLLHRADQYPDGEERFGEVDLIVGKNRNGPAPLTIPLAFQGYYGRVASLAR